MPHRLVLNIKGHLKPLTLKKKKSFAMLFGHAGGILVSESVEHVMYRYQKELIQVSAFRNDMKVQYIYNVNVLIRQKS